MPRLLSKPLSSEYAIEDTTGDWKVVFFQLTEGDYIALGEIEGKRELLYDNEGQFSGVREHNNRRRALRLAVYKAMGSCSLTWEDTGDLLFDTKDGWVKKAMSEQSFNRTWDLLPPETASLIIEKFYEANPTLKPGE